MHFGLTYDSIVWSYGSRLQCVQRVCVLCLVIQVYRGLMSFSVSDDDTQCCCLVSLTIINYKSYISVAAKGHEHQEESTQSFTQNWFIQLTLRPWSLRSHTKIKHHLQCLYNATCGNKWHLRKKKLINKKVYILNPYRKSLLVDTNTDCLDGFKR